MTKAVILFFFIVLIWGSASCKQDKKKAKVEEILSEWVGKKIHFPDKYTCNLSGKDTAFTICTELFEREYKILLYVDSTDCTGCKLRLSEWKRTIEEAAILSEGKLSFLFFFHPKDKKELQFLFLRDKFNYPVFIDSGNTLEQLNHFPKQPEYQCFLLDKDNKVLLLGNPVLNLKIWELYKQAITGEKSRNPDETRDFGGKSGPSGATAYWSSIFHTTPAGIK